MPDYTATLPTDDEVNDLVNEWRKRYRLMDWSFTWSWIEKERMGVSEFGDPLAASVDYDLASQNAHINLLEGDWPIKIRGAVDMTLDFTIGHELAHILLGQVGMERLEDGWHILVAPQLHDKMQTLIAEMREAACDRITSLFVKK